MLAIPEKRDKNVMKLNVMCVYPSIQNETQKNKEHCNLNFLNNNFLQSPFKLNYF